MDLDFFEKLIVAQRVSKLLSLKKREGSLQCSWMPTIGTCHKSVFNLIQSAASFYEILFNIILVSIPLTPKWFLPMGHSDQDLMQVSDLPLTSHMSCETRSYDLIIKATFCE
jgi:hypothetical protein